MKQLLSCYYYYYYCLHSYLLFIYSFIHSFCIYCFLFICMFICSPFAFHFFLTSHVLLPLLFFRSHSYIHYFFLSPCLVSNSHTSYCEMLGSNLGLIIASHDRFFQGDLTVSRKIVGIYLKLSHDNFVTRASQMSIFSLSLSLTTVLSELPTDPLNKQ